MERFTKQFSNTGQQARDLFNDINAWVQANISEVDETASGNSESLVSAGDYSNWAKSLLMYLRTRGERTVLMENALYVCSAVGEGWRTSYLSGKLDGEHVTEVVVCIDNDAVAVQCKLACL